MLVNRKITALRKEKGMTMSALASATGIAQTSISRYESGKIKKIDESKLAAIANALGVPVRELTKDDPIYDLASKRGAYSKQADSVSIQDELDKEMLFAYHQLPMDFRYALLRFIRSLPVNS